MPILFPLFILPGLYLFLLVSLFLQGKRGTVGFSLLIFALAVVTEHWAITRSRASTAGIGFIFLPLIASLAGLLALAYAEWRESPNAATRFFGWVALGGALVQIGAQVVSGVRTIERNKRRDGEYAAQEKDIARYRKTIDDTLARSAGREGEVIDRMIRERGGERAFLIPALESRYVSPALLDSFARSEDLGVALQAVRNPNTGAATLERIYRSHSYPDYFFQALAAHPNTPPGVLRAIYERPRTISGLEIWFARNPATPVDILGRIARASRDVNVIQGLLENPNLDCDMLRAAAGNLAASDRPADTYSHARIAERRPTLCG